MRQVDPGNVVHASDANGIVVITQLQPITVVFPIPEDNVPRVLKRLRERRADRSSRRGTATRRAKLATGKLLTVDNQIDTTTGTVKLKAEFAERPISRSFRTSSSTCACWCETLPDATLVPSAAIQRGAPGTFVYVVKDDKTVTVAPVKLGPVQGEVTAIASGVSPGDMVVVDGTDKLREGAKVELITRDAQAAPAASAARAAARRSGRRASGPRPEGQRRAKDGG